MLTPTAESNAARDRLFAQLAEWVHANDTPGLQQHRYGDAAEQVADLRTPVGPVPHPVVVLIHGGNWRAAHSKATIEAVAVDLVSNGWATWNIEYRRVGNGGGVPATGEDVTAAIRGLEEIPGLDLERLVVLGHSSGGQLALCAARETRAAAVVSIAGYSDLSSASRLGLGDNAISEFCGGLPEEVPGNYLAEDPIRHLPLGKKTLLVHGTADDRVPADQSSSYAAAASRAGDLCELMLLQGAGHFDVIDPRSEHWRAVAVALPGLLK